MKDLTGRVFGRLTVMKVAGKERRAIKWECLCSCGNVKHVLSANLLAGLIKSCGCLRKEVTSKRRKFKLIKSESPLSKTPEYKCWAGIIARCERQYNTAFKKYGAKGITVCKRWREDFQNFLLDMGRKPSPMHSIDRIDGKKGYYKSNCRWATPIEQMINRSCMAKITWNGETKTRYEWAKDLGITSYVLKQRLDKWPIDLAMTTPNVNKTRSKQKLCTY